VVDRGHEPEPKRSATSTQDKAALGERVERRLEGAEVAREQQPKRRAGGAGRAQPAAQDRRAGALLGLGEEIEQDRQLGPVVELAADQVQRLGVERRQQLLVAQAEELLQMARRADSLRRRRPTPSRR
jgi:hypothetical protein